MSSTITDPQKSPKKRKHAGDVKTPKKKRKHHEAEAEPNGVEELEDVTPKSSKKDKRNNKQDSSRDTDRENNDKALSDLADNSQKSKADIKKRKRAKEPEPEVAQDEPEDEVNALAELQDKAMVDLDEAEHNPAHEVVQENAVEGEIADSAQLDSDAKTAFHSTRMSLYLPIPAIALQNALSAVLVCHIAPLLLTYFPPASGVVLSYHDPVLSARPQAGLSRPLLPPEDGDPEAPEAQGTLSRMGDEFGASWAWLTITFLVFKPHPGDELQGWTNAKSEGFIGLVSYNYFQTSISKSRIPRAWTWDGPSKQTHRQRKAARKGKLNDSDEPSQDDVAESEETVEAREDDAIDGSAGNFVDENGRQMAENLTFKVIDLEIIPAQERGQRFALQLEGTLLSQDDENEVREEERQKWENRQSRKKARAKAPGTPMMSGGLPTHSRAGSVVSTP